MGHLQDLQQELVAEFSELEQKIQETAAAVERNQEAYEQADAALDVRSMKKYGQELEIEQETLQRLQEKRRAMIEAGNKERYKRAAAGIGADQDAANAAEDGRRAQVAALLQEAAALLAEIKTAERAAEDQIRAEVRPILPYLKREEQQYLASTLAGLNFYSLKHQQEAIKTAQRAFQ